MILLVSLEVILLHLLRHLGSHPPGEGGCQGLSEAVEHASSWTTGIIYTPEGWCIQLSLRVAWYRLVELGSLVHSLVVW